MRDTMLKIRTTSQAKTVTVKTLDMHGITISDAYHRLSSGKGLVARQDAELMEDCRKLHKRIRHIIPRTPIITEQKAVRYAYRKSVVPAKQKVEQVLENLISGLESGNRPVYPLLGNDTAMYDDFYTIRVPFDGRASASGEDYSQKVRTMLDFITDIEPRSTAAHVMARAGLEDILKDAEDILTSGYVDIEKKIKADNAVMEALAKRLTDAADILASQELRKNL